MDIDGQQNDTDKDLERQLQSVDMSGVDEAASVNHNVISFMCQINSQLGKLLLFCAGSNDFILFSSPERGDELFKICDSKDEVVRSIAYSCFYENNK